MDKFKGIAIEKIKEIYCNGGPMGGRIVHVVQSKKSTSQAYLSGRSSVEEIVSFGFLLDDFVEATRLDVNLAGDVLSVVSTGEVLEPTRAKLLDGSDIDFLAVEKSESS